MLFKSRRQQQQGFFFPPSQDTLITLSTFGYQKKSKHYSMSLTNDMFQQWRALIQSLICAYWKDSGFERPVKSSVLQIIWWRHHRAHIICRKDLWKNSSILPTFSKKKESGTTQSGKKESHYHCRSKNQKVKCLGCLSETELITDDMSRAELLRCLSKEVAQAYRSLAGKGSLFEESRKDAPVHIGGPSPTCGVQGNDTGKYSHFRRCRRKRKGESRLMRKLALSGFLLNFKLKEKSPTEQYIFQRRTSAPTEPSGHDESSSLYAELGLTESDTESDEEVPPVVKSGAPDEGSDGPIPGTQDEGSRTKPW
ncbi:hypothetical protein Tco_0968442 [Tanacetum coccineum]